MRGYHGNFNFVDSCEDCEVPFHRFIPQFPRIFNQYLFASLVQNLRFMSINLPVFSPRFHACIPWETNGRSQLVRFQGQPRHGWTRPMRRCDQALVPDEDVQLGMEVHQWGYGEGRYIGVHTRDIHAGSYVWRYLPCIHMCTCVHVYVYIYR